MSDFIVRKEDHEIGCKNGQNSLERLKMPKYEVLWLFLASRFR